MTTALERLLAAGLRELPLEVDAERQGRLLAFLGLLEKWNGVYNLTAVRDPAEMVTLHLLDSLAVLPHVRGERLLDVGAGPGLPGIPLAIVAPGRRYTLLDSNGKKVRFMRQAVLELGLQQVEVVQARVESYRPDAPFDTVISRAFASLREFVGLAGAHCAPGGRLLAMKGQYPEAELAELPPGWRAVAVHRLAIPGLAAQRHLVELAEGPE